MPTRVRVIEVETDTEGETTALAAALRILQSGPGSPPVQPFPGLLPPTERSALPASAPPPLSLQERGPGGEAEPTVLKSSGAVTLGDPDAPPAPAALVDAGRPIRKARRAVVGADQRVRPPARRPAKPYACTHPGCAFSSGTQAGLTRHTHQQHPTPAVVGRASKPDAAAATPSPTKIVGAFTCALCHKQLTKQSDLARHMKMAHQRHTPATRTPRAPSTLPPDPGRPLADDDDADPFTDED